MKTGAVIVTYNADIQKLTKSMSRLAAEVDEVCVVDNTRDDSLRPVLSAFANCTYFPQYKNTGIAAAQNVGIRHFISQHFDFVLFSDQDTLMPEGTVGQLYDIFRKLESKRYSPGAVCPRAYNASTGDAYPHQVNAIGPLTIDNHHLTEVTYTMNSISFIPLRLFAEVGLMEESLFIDGVDSEWCWRANRQKGVRFFVDEDLRISHLLGNGERTVGGKSISITPPYRMFYQYRNYLWLCRRSYVPLKWKCYNGFKYLAKVAYYGLLDKQRKEYLRQMAKGLRAGIRKNNNI